MDNSHIVNPSTSLITEDLMPRPRINKILDEATKCKLVYVVAGAGYGKTQAVHHYIEQHPDAIVRWVQLVEGDNIGSRYWESLTHNIAFDNPDLAVRLRELGFPETSSRFRQFAEIQKTAEHRSHRTFLVLDDFHLIHSKQALTFAERCAHLHIPGACVIIISRKEPEINAVSLFSKAQASRITENELCFTASEIVDFFKHNDIPFSISDLSQLTEATKGWALAVKLLSMVLKRMPTKMQHALKTMKQNIFKLMETESWGDFPETVQKVLVNLSLISDLPLTSLQDVFNDNSLLDYASRLSPFLWFDSFIGDYRIHPLYLEFLQTRKYILSEEETNDTYKKVAQWCVNNDFFTDAVNYYAKSNQYDQMLDILLSHPFKLPYDSCEYFLSILEKLDPDDNERNNRSILLLKNLFIPLLYMGMGRFDDARNRSFDIIKKWEHADEPMASYLLYTAYSNLAYIKTYTCTVTHDYDFPKYLKKAVGYFKQSSTQPVGVAGPFSVVDIRSYACLVGEGAELSEFDVFQKAADDAAVFIEETYHNMYHGYAELLACELAFFRNQVDLARKHAYSAVVKARGKKQYSIEVFAQYYLLRIAVHEGDYQLVKETLRQVSAHLNNPDFWNRQQLYDLLTGSFYAYIGLPEMVPSWIIDYEKDTTTEVRIPVRELVASVGYMIASKKYKQALAMLCNSYPRDPQERFHFGEMAFSLLLAVAQLQTGNNPEAIKAFEKAYAMSFNGEFEIHFIELGSSFHKLAVAASKQESCIIPEAWLKATDRKASIYAKKADAIVNSIKREKNIEDSVSLSDRERDVLNDLYLGLSREEIAANRYISINTVKKILQSIYIKLDANNNVDAIRIAMEKRLIV